MLPLDRIYADGPAILGDVCVYRSPLTRLASDHLPLVGRLYWAGREPPRREGLKISRRRRRSAGKPIADR